MLACKIIRFDNCLLVSTYQKLYCLYHPLISYRNIRFISQRLVEWEISLLKMKHYAQEYLLYTYHLNTNTAQYILWVFLSSISAAAPFRISTLSYKLTFLRSRESILFDEDLSRSDFCEKSHFLYSTNNQRVTKRPLFYHYQKGFLI